MKETCRLLDHGGVCTGMCISNVVLTLYTVTNASISIGKFIVLCIFGWGHKRYAQKEDRKKVIVVSEITRSEMQWKSKKG